MCVGTANNNETLQYVDDIVKIECLSGTLACDTNDDCSTYGEDYCCGNVTHYVPKTQSF